MRFATVLAMAIVLGAAPAFAQAARGGGFEVLTLSARADMVSGGDVLIQIAAPPSTGTNIAITVNGLKPNAIGKVTPSGTTLIARIYDLRLGRNVIALGVNGQRPAVQLAVVNHPITGPVVSGPHQTPFTCETQALSLGPPLDADCTVATQIEYFYRSNLTSEATRPFKPYDATGPKPADLATTTTLDGKTVPYIVRREKGTINRAVYVIAFLHEPGTPLPDPWSAAASSWNGRLIYSFGAGCQAGYHQGRTVGGPWATGSTLRKASSATTASRRGMRSLRHHSMRSAPAATM